MDSDYLAIVYWLRERKERSTVAMGSHPACFSAWVVAWTLAVTWFAAPSAVHAFSHLVVVQDASALHELACTEPKKSDAPWNIANLYDCETRQLFVPYQLWSGAMWDGNKEAPCMHTADTLFHVNNRSATTIQGPKEWKGRQIWARAKVNGSKTQYFECHGKGIGRVYEIRNGRERTYRKTGRCKFPGGYGWVPGKRRECAGTALKIYSIEFDGDHNFSALEFEYWFLSRSRGQHVLDHKYRYVPEQGMTNAWPQR